MALSFNGTNQYLSQAAALFGSTGATPCSIALWYMPTNNTGTQSLFSSGSGSAVDYLNLRTATGVATTVYENASDGGGALESSSTPTTATASSWNHLVAVFSGSGATTVYLNGVAGGAATGGPDTPTGLSQTILGGLYSSGAVTQFANGAIAYPAGWTGYALTSTDVTNLYNAGSGFNPQSLSTPPNASFSTLQTATTPPDVVSGNNWTVHGSPTVVTDPFTLGGSAPTVLASAPALVTATSATFQGNISSSNGANTTTEGFKYGLTTGLGTDTHTTTTITTGTFSILVTALTPSTAYYYQAYGINTNGTGTSSGFISFTTLQSGTTTGTVLYDGNTATGISGLGESTAALWDSSSATAWQTTQTSGDWVGLNAGAQIVLSYLKYSALPLSEDTLIGGVFQGSNSATFASGVATLATISTRPLSGTLVNKVTINSGTAYQYYRYLMPTSAFAQNGNLADLQLFGSYASGAYPTAAPVDCSPKGGHFAVPTRIRLSCPTASCSIYYTLDGSTPTQSSTLYTAPFVLSSSAVLNAIAFGPNVAPSYMTTFYLYVQNELVVADPPIDVNRNQPLHLVGADYFYDPVGGYWWVTGNNLDNILTGYYNVSNTWRSADFKNWEYVGPTVGPGFGSGILNGSYTGKQYAPIIVYSYANNQYCSLAKEPGVALTFYTASNPAGPWTLAETYSGNINGNNCNSQDSHLFQDPSNNTVYLVTGYGTGSPGFMVAQMNSDCLTFTGTSSTIPNASWNPTIREGWTMANYNGEYFLLFSGQTSWTPNLNEYIQASTPLMSSNAGITNPFQSYGGSIPYYTASGFTPTYANAFDSQSNQIVYIPGRNAYIYNGSRYDATNSLTNFSHTQPILLPIVFSGSGGSATMSISWPGTNSWVMDTVFPTVSGAPAAPTNLRVLVGGAATWTNNEPLAVNVFLDTANDSGFTTNVASEVVSPMDGSTTTPPSSFSVTVPGTYYRIRVVNGNGSSLSGIVQLTSNTSNTSTTLSGVLSTNDTLIQSIVGETQQQIINNIAGGPNPFNDTVTSTYTAPPPEYQNEYLKAFRQSDYSYRI